VISINVIGNLARFLRVTVHLNMSEQKDGQLPLATRTPATEKGSSSREILLTELTK
jgi:predicted DNA-binding ribbon-helix-helix protein